MKEILAVLVFLLGVVLGLWLGVWVLLVGGLIQFINGLIALQAAPIAIGIVKVMFSGVVGWLSFLLCTAFASVLVDS